MKVVSALLLAELTVGALGAKTKPRNRKFRQNTRGTQENVIQVTEYECNSKTSSFSSSVLMDFHQDVSMLGDDALLQLQESFVETYNEVAFAMCDYPFFRTLTDTEINPLATSDDSMYREFEIDLFKPTNLTHLLKVDIHAACRKCEEDTIFSGTGFGGDISGNLELVSPVASGKQGSSATEVKSHYDDSVCLCPNGAPPENRTQTETEFLEFFRPMVATLEEGDLPDDFDFFEVDSASCDKSANEVSAVVYLRLNGDMAGLGDDDFLALEEAFIATYNGLNFAYCDSSHYRTVTNVTLDRSSFEEVSKRSGLDRQLQEEMANVDLDFDENVLLMSSSSSVLRFEITFECRNCKEGAPLFAFDSGMTMDEIMDHLPPLDVILGRSNKLQGSSGYCYCPSHPEPKHRAPTTDEFQAALDLTLAALKDSGYLAQVSKVDDVLEITEVDCDFDYQEFSSAVFVELEAPLSELSELEKFTIEDSFRQSYNALTFSACDQFFREATAVTVVSTRTFAEGGRRQQEGVDANATTTEAEIMSNNMTDRFPAVFSVIARCRNCKVDESGSFQLFDDIFDDESNRRALSAEQMASSIVFGSSVPPSFGDSQRLLQTEDSRVPVCTCPADVASTAESLSKDTFIDIFNGRITDLEGSGILTGVPLVEDLFEAGDVCDGETFLAFTDRYELGFFGAVDEVPNEVIGALFRRAYISTREENCDPLVSSASVIQRNGEPVMQVEMRQDSEYDRQDLSFVRLMVDSLQFEAGSLFADEEETNRFIFIYNTIAEEEGIPGILVTAMYDPSEAPSFAPSGTPTRKPTRYPTRKPTPSPSRSPSAHPSRHPSSSPTHEPTHEPTSATPTTGPPSPFPTLNRAMCTDQVTELSDHVIIDYAISRVADIDLNLPWGMTMPDSWPLEEPATMIAAEEFIAAYNGLQKNTFCDPFKRRIVSMSCVATENNVLSGSLCCTVHFKCKGNCEKFIYPDRDPIGAFYDQPGFEYPTDDTCSCDIQDSVLRAPSAGEHFNRLNNNVPLEILAFEFKGFATSECPH